MEKIKIKYEKEGDEYNYKWSGYQEASLRKRHLSKTLKEVRHLATVRKQRDGYAEKGRGVVKMWFLLTAEERALQTKTTMSVNTVRQSMPPSRFRESKEWIKRCHFCKIVWCIFKEIYEKIFTEIAMGIYLSGRMSIIHLQMFWFVWMVSNGSILFCHQKKKWFLFSFWKKSELAYIHSWI